jgi:biopolymer transport protein ExbB/TolQ
LILIIVTIAIIVSFILLAYKAFISRIIKEKMYSMKQKFFIRKNWLENIKAQEEERKR